MRKNPRCMLLCFNIHHIESGWLIPKGNILEIQMIELLSSRWGREVSLRVCFFGRNEALRNNHFQNMTIAWLMACDDDSWSFY